MSPSNEASQTLPSAPPPGAAPESDRDFASRVVTFLDGCLDRRTDQASSWGIGPEDLALFHETSDAEELKEAHAAKEWQRARWDAGFGWITGPQEYGGAGLSQQHESLYRTIEANYTIPDMSPVRLGLGTVVPAIVAAGSPYLLHNYAVGIQRGDLIGCQLFSEPEAGSDLAGVRTKAVRAGGHWTITGQKVWTSNATFSDVGLALVRTDPDAPKHRGLTMFLVPMNSPGVEVRPLRQMTGGASFTEVFLSEVELADELRVGDVGSGWQVATRALSHERRSVGDRSHEMTFRALNLLRILADRSGKGSDPIVVDQWVRLYMRLRIARFQQQRMQAIPESELSGAERAMDKVLLSTNMRLIGELAGDLLGPRFTADTREWGTFAWNRWMMGALGYRIAGGTEEILKNMLAERVLSLPRDTKR
jgi:alkylation response protein AidB-like acyl-CoA dehydrogenase